MKIEIRKVNEPDGSYWYGIWVNNSCQIPSYGKDLTAATIAYEKIVDNMLKPKPRYETIKETEL